MNNKEELLKCTLQKCNHKHGEINLVAFDEVYDCSMGYVSAKKMNETARLGPLIWQNYQLAIAQLKSKQEVILNGLGQLMCLIKTAICAVGNQAFDGPAWNQQQLILEKQLGFGIQQAAYIVREWESKNCNINNLLAMLIMAERATFGKAEATFLNFENARGETAIINGKVESVDQICKLIKEATEAWKMIVAMTQKINEKSLFHAAEFITTKFGVSYMINVRVFGSKRGAKLEATKQVIWANLSVKNEKTEIDYEAISKIMGLDASDLDWKSNSIGKGQGRNREDEAEETNSKLKRRVY